MRIQIPDYIVTSAVRAGLTPSQAASVRLAVEEPIATFKIGDRTRFDGHGISVVGRFDRTEKSFTVMAIRVDRDHKA